MEQKEPEEDHMAGRMKNMSTDLIEKFELQKELIGEGLKSQVKQMKEQQHYSALMPKNKFFKQFAYDHQKELENKIDEAYGQDSYYHKSMVKHGIHAPFK